MLISFDADAGTVYIIIKEDRVVSTKEISPEIFADFNKKDEIVGIEILNP